MEYKVVAIRDRVADVYGQPIFVASVGSAIRSFGDEVNNKREGNNLANHPEDFDLYLLGTFDDETASFEGLPQPKQIAIGKDLVR